jgi:hypothetical protein
MLSSHYFCPILEKFEFSRLVFEKYSTINFHENPFSRTRVVPCDQMDRHNEVTHFSQFCEHAIKRNWKLKSVISLSQSRSQSVGRILLGHEYFLEISALSRDSRGPSTDRSSIQRVLPLVLARTRCGRKVMRLATLCSNRQSCCLPLHMAVTLTPAVDSVQV